MNKITLQEKSHPALLSYKETINENFPMILIIGREPNKQTKSDNTVGVFDFDSFKNCGFWNSSFNLLATYNSKDTYQIKKIFRQYNSSPIIFGDASPKGIPNEIKNKSALRKKLTNEDFDHQLEVIFDNKKILSRVRLILLSGLHESAFSYFNNQITIKAKELNIPTKQISFLYGSNLPIIKTELTEKEVNIFKSVFEDFVTSKKIKATHNKMQIS